MAKSNEMINFLALGAGSFGGGAATKALPNLNPMVKSAGVTVIGYFLAKQKDDKVKFLGYGMLGRGIASLGEQLTGISEEAIAENFDTVDDEALAEEIAAEIAAEMDEDMAADNDDTTM